MSNVPPPPPSHPNDPAAPPVPPGAYPAQPYPGQPYPGQPVYGPGGVNGRPYASFGQRLGAYLLDGLTYGLLLAAFILTAFALGGSQFTCTQTVAGEVTECEVTGSGGMVGLAVLIGIIGYIVVGFLYISGIAKRGQTWGCRIVGLRIVTETGEVPGWGKAIGRSLFAYFISGYIFFLGYLWMLWDDRKQTLQDKVAGTYVISE